MAAGITREQKCAHSVLEFVRALLVGRYAADDYEVRESFPYKDIEEATAIRKQHIALGFQFDDGGRDGEMGSNFTRLLHTFEVFVFATSDPWGENLATRIAESIHAAELVPLLDPENGNAVIDQMIVEQSVAARQPVRNPRPWEEHVWLCTAKLWDEFYPEQA